MNQRGEGESGMMLGLAALGLLFYYGCAGCTDFRKDVNHCDNMNLRSGDTVSVTRGFYSGKVGVVVSPADRIMDYNIKFEDGLIGKVYCGNIERRIK